MAINISSRAEDYIKTRWDAITVQLETRGG